MGAWCDPSGLPDPGTAWRVLCPREMPLPRPLGPNRLCVAWLAMATACGFDSLFGDGESTRFGSGSGGAKSGTPANDTPSGGTGIQEPSASTALSGGGDASEAAGTRAPPKDPRVCVFDYDLTLSSHNCPDTEGKAEYFCRENACDTYGWYPQCLAVGARAAIAECVRRGAFIGIASKAMVDYCWSDKVLPIVSQHQFPELTGNAVAADAAAPISYPQIDERSNWNCDDCAYTMDGSLGKPDGIRRVMRHYGLDPDLAEDRARVIFWDDTKANITDVEAAMPEVRSVLVPSFTGNGVDGGCGMTQAEIDAGWAP